MKDQPQPIEYSLPIEGILEYGGHQLPYEYAPEHIHSWDERDESWAAERSEYEQELDRYLLESEEQDD